MKNRDRGNGRYTHAERWERLCVCGHTLGDHTAAAHKGERPCIVGDFGHEQCDCRKFRPAKAAKAARDPFEVTDRRIAYLRSRGENERNTVAWRDAVEERRQLAMYLALNAR